MSKFETFQKAKTPGKANWKSLLNIFAGFQKIKRKLTKKN